MSSSSISSDNLQQEANPEASKDEETKHMNNKEGVSQENIIRHKDDVAENKQERVRNNQQYIQRSKIILWFNSYLDSQLFFLILML